MFQLQHWETRGGDGHERLRLSSPFLSPQSQLGGSSSAQQSSSGSRPTHGSSSDKRTKVRPGAPRPPRRLHWLRERGGRAGGHPLPLGRARALPGSLGWEGEERGKKKKKKKRIPSLTTDCFGIIRSQFVLLGLHTQML